MMREILLFAVDIGYGRKVYEATFLDLSTKDRCLKVFHACRQYLKEPATEVQRNSRPVLDLENNLRCVFSCREGQLLVGIINNLSRKSSAQNIHRAYCVKEEDIYTTTDIVH